jgi:hypothetical protein
LCFCFEGVNHKSVTLNNEGKNLKGLRLQSVEEYVLHQMACMYSRMAVSGNEGTYFLKNESEWFGTCYSFQKTWIGEYTLPHCRREVSF